uniref:Macaca fascicularis brain cDNA clone: QflA-17151, similar to human protein phosphatase 2C, magnesium-dependent, catalyticsubunit (PPM2C), nuclear gene encoding mitochondrialprotein, mRNA, RefSeq: N... n=1 Tax=Macaca fascicularis TaxID=9541 RepID=I7GMH7_MACFA|nr:unnamed protein product [Macaca fascicularis]
MLSAPCCDDRRMCVCPGPRRIGIPVRSSSLPLRFQCT